MLNPDGIPLVREAMRERAIEDRQVLDALREEIRPFRDSVRRISPRSTTAMSLVASDAGNNKIEFDPFLVQIVRVVDSYGRELCLDVVSPTTDTEQLSDKQFDSAGNPRTALGYMMKELGVRKLFHLSPMIPEPKDPRGPDLNAVKPSWVLVYRDLCEWAVLYERIRRFEFATDTLIVLDGLLRSKVFAKDLFMVWRTNIKAGIEAARERLRRKLYVVGVAKHSSVLTRYRLAMAIEGIMEDPHPCYLEIPRSLERKAYIWPEYARAAEDTTGGEAPKFVAGKMFLAKFGGRPHDPIWAVDLLDFQTLDAPLIFGYLLADCMDGFPVPFYPRCLQKAHENAALVGFDMDILQEEVFKSLREALPQGREHVLDTFRFHTDPSSLRYE